MFADDTTLITQGVPDRSDVSLTHAERWFSTNELKLNNAKTQKILFSSDKWGKKSEPVKLLDMQLDTNLNCVPHVNQFCSKLASQLYVIRQLKNCVNKDVVITIYYALISCHLAYGDVLWGNSVKSNKAFIFQKVVVRIIDGARFNAPCQQIFK